MGPKKDKGKGKGGPATMKEVVLGDYLRQPIEISDEGAEPVGPLGTLKSGKITNIEEIFPAWEGTEGEDWAAPVETPAELSYPDHIIFQESKTVKDIFDIVVEAPPPAKGKKGAPPEPIEFKEDVRTAEGKLLPRVFYDALPPQPDLDPEATEGETPSIITAAIESDKWKSYDFMNSFKREWSKDQISRRQVLDEMKSIAEAAEAKQAEELAAAKAEATADGDPETTPDEGSTKEIPVVKERQNYNDALAERDVNNETPNGSYRDALMIEAFNLIQWFAPSLEKKRAKAIIDASSATTETKEGGEASEEAPTETVVPPSSYLWRSIYPQLPNGRPAYNPSGRYIVKLFVGGNWRKIEIDDCFPIGSDGQVAIASSSEPLELWPSLLAKAVYLAYYKCGYTTISGSLGLAEPIMPKEVEETSDVVDGETAENTDGEAKAEADTSSVPESNNGDGSAIPTTTIPLQASSSTASIVTPEILVARERSSTAKNCAHFVSFVLTALTGWTGASPWDVHRTMARSDELVLSLVEDMIVGGAPMLKEADIPSLYLYTPSNPLGESPEELAALTGHGTEGSTTSPRGHPSTNTTAGVIAAEEEEEGSLVEGSLNSIALVPHGYATKKHHRTVYENRIDALKSLVHRIEERETLITSLTDSIARPFDEMGAVIMAPSAPGAEVRILPILGVCYSIENEDESSTSHRSTSSLRLLVDWHTYPNSGPITDPRGEALPSGTGVDYQWVTMNDLANEFGYVISLDTHYYNGGEYNNVVLDRHWTVAAPPEEAGGKKGKGKEAEIDSSSLPKTELSPIPLTLLKVSPTNQNDSLPLTISICADLTVDMSTTSNDDEDTSITEAGDVIVILEQIVQPNSNTTPLLLRTELKNLHSVLPYTKATFHIPSSCFQSLTSSTETPVPDEITSPLESVIESNQTMLFIGCRDGAAANQLAFVF